MEYYSSLDASQLDAETPTLFELISANQLEALLSPSLRYILVYYAQRYPQRLLKVTNRFDEINLFFRTFIEWYFIKYWQGSFTENFYGIKRVAQTPLSNSKYNMSKLTQLVPSMVEQRRSLSALQMFVSVFEITGVAYISEKLTYRYELLYSKYATNQLNEKEVPPEQRRKVYLQRKFVEWYPHLQTAWRLGNLAATLAYLSGASKSPSLLTFLFKMNYSRLNAYDYAKNEPALPNPHEKVPHRVAPPSLSEALLHFVTRNFAKPLWRAVRYLLGTFFPLAIFTLKFLEWWNTSEFAQKVAKSQANTLEDTIPPASLLKRRFRSGSKCPLCKEDISNPAIIETGHVFCYTCIYNYLRDSHKLVQEKLDGELSDETDPESDLDNEEAEPIIRYDVSRGGRCPITGRKLLGCKYNTTTGEFDVDGIRRLIF